ncbi:hypothetical protein UMZ34_14430 [Halopseudomonas pachastrellae]|nr:hypothetical protein UMZ34_14430 [Halopseudomonas pachastrellae]
MMTRVCALRRQAGGGRYLSVADAGGLSDALGHIVGEVGAHSGFVSAATLDGQTLSAGRLRVRSQYHARDWSGRLELLALDRSGAEQGVIWRSDSQFVPGGLRGRYQSWRQADGLKPAGPVTLRGAGLPPWRLSRNNSYWRWPRGLACMAPTPGNSCSIGRVACRYWAARTHPPAGRQRAQRAQAFDGWGAPVGQRGGRLPRLSAATRGFG